MNVEGNGCSLYEVLSWRSPGWAGGKLQRKKKLHQTSV